MTAARGARPLGLLSRSDGQALVEFALVLPLLALLVFAVFDFGRALDYQGRLTDLASQAVRYAEYGDLHPCSGGTIESCVLESADAVELRTGATVSLCLPAGSSQAAGQSIHASASYQYHWLAALGEIAGFFGAGGGLGTTTIVGGATGLQQSPDGFDPGTAVPPCSA